MAQGSIVFQPVFLFGPKRRLRNNRRLIAKTLISTIPVIPKSINNASERVLLKFVERGELDESKEGTCPATDLFQAE
jgi:hypothetical protein